MGGWILHTLICGDLLSVYLWEGTCIFLSIIDDSSKKVCVYVLNNKVKVFEKFKEWKNWWKTKLGKD